MKFYKLIVSIFSIEKSGTFIIAKDEEHAIKIATENHFTVHCIDEAELNDSVQNLINSGKTGFVCCQLDLFDNARNVWLFSKVVK